MLGVLAFLKTEMTFETRVGIEKLDLVKICYCVVQSVKFYVDTLLSI